MWYFLVLIAGYGDMAMSNTIGSNVFDILFGLGVPWLISTTAVNPGSVVYINRFMPMLICIFSYTACNILDIIGLICGIINMVSTQSAHSNHTFSGQYINNSNISYYPA